MTTAINESHESIRVFYGGLLKVLLERKTLPIMAILTIFSGSVASLYFQGGELFPKEDINTLTYQIQFPIGQNLDRTDKEFEKMEEILKRFRGIERIS